MDQKSSFSITGQMPGHLVGGNLSKPQMLKTMRTQCACARGRYWSLLITPIFLRDIVLNISRIISRSC
jgi:hypothetical protein